MIFNQEKQKTPRNDTDSPPLYSTVKLYNTAHQPFWTLAETQLHAVVCTDKPNTSTWVASNRLPESLLTFRGCFVKPWTSPECTEPSAPGEIRIPIEL